jgi:hypothetical protein
VGLNLRTGRQVFFFPDGAFNPVICDYGAIYLSGYSRLYQLLPKRRGRRHPAAGQASGSARASAQQQRRG